jgi:hypothetical protein
MRAIKVLTIIVIVSMSAGAGYALWYLYDHTPKVQASTEVSASERRSQIMEHMPPEAKAYMNIERGLNVEAFSKAFESLTAAEKEQVRLVIEQTKENAEDERKLFDSLSPEQKRALRGHSNGPEIDQATRDKFLFLARRRQELAEQIPEKIKNIQIDPADKALLNRKSRRS